MARRDSLGVQFNNVVGKRIRQMSYVKTLELMKHLCRLTIQAFSQNKLFYDITGNALTSFSVGVFYKGKRVYAEYMSDMEDSPTRATLRKGERYNLPEYYDGRPSAGYTGSVGHGGQWGPTLGHSRLSRTHSRVRDTWNLVAVLPVEYAGYNARIYKTMCNTLEEYPDLFSASVLYARGSNIGSI